MDILLAETTTVIQVYAPKEGTAVKTVEEFYEIRKDQIDQAGKKEQEVLIMEMGEWETIWNRRCH